MIHSPAGYKGQAIYFAMYWQQQTHSWQSDTVRIVDYLFVIGSHVVMIS